MPNKIKTIELTEADIEYLNNLLARPTTEARVYVRSKILLNKNAGYSNEYIADKLDISLLLCAYASINSMLQVLKML